MRGGRTAGVLALAAALLAPLGLSAAAPAAAASARTEETISVPVGPEPDGSAVALDATVVSPGGGARHPAVLLTHGFGGSKDDLLERARELADAGYVALAYTSRGFGASGGRIHLADPDFEIADGTALLDTLAGRPDVQLDGAGDPRVGAAGGSYGGATSLMLAGADRRVDATAASITWNDLSAAFVPGGSGGQAGVFKRRWTSVFFSRAVEASRGRADADPVCGRFDPGVCRIFLDAARTGTPSAPMTRLLSRHSPAPTLPAVQAPSLLVQGMRDSLFDLGQADATARTLQGRGVPVAVRWFEGGHDGGADEREGADLRTWFDRYLTDDGRGRTGLPVPAFRAPVPAGAADRSVTSSTYQGLGGLDGSSAQVPLAAGAGATILSPPGGDPAAISGIGAAFGAIGDAAESGSGSGSGSGGEGGGLVGYPLAALPGQSVAFDTQPLADPQQVVGTPTVRLRVTSTARDATLFVSWWRMGNAGPSSPRAQVSPVRVATTPGRPVDVTVPLPSGTYAPSAGSRWRVLVSATDAGFAVPTDARSYRIELADPTLRLPTAPAAAATDGRVDVPGLDPEVAAVGIGLAALLALVAAGFGAAAWRRRRTDRADTRADLAAVPLVVDDLVKTYRDGHRAVDGVSWRAEAGQVVGLLGPNGAGKTTTMRMLVGLIRPESGQVHVLGDPVHAGAPVLDRVGALIEGPGFLPHLTGRANLQAYWAATGRDPGEADLEAALEVAALGDAVDRPVRTYSQGMRQRLGIAQAMLGRPEVLLLDEPTNGLDPPQIAAMRPILRDYAAGGRTVVVSSHLLSEVEQTCTHVVVMNRGRVVAAGSVADLLAGDEASVVALAPGSDPARIADAVRADLRDAAEQVRVDPVAGTLTCTGGASRGRVVAAVVAAGGDVVGVSGRRRLEEVFLGVIGAGDDGAAGSAGSTGGTDASQESEEERMERLRKVRTR
ncbi:alpha/beta fold hydrolase [Agilicoccus flavus]|uniref:alpha/beta fold hydrolase n=1 Tax=Agilicoccus flavus TaxID=2775968 RepID=UPI001CF60C2F|nr:alpha/beta fold hydrolase [Agilicoccus flavus]